VGGGGRGVGGGGVQESSENSLINSQTKRGYAKDMLQKGGTRALQKTNPKRQYKKKKKEKKRAGQAADVVSSLSSVQVFTTRGRS